MIPKRKITAADAILAVLLLLLAGALFLSALLRDPGTADGFTIETPDGVTSYSLTNGTYRVEGNGVTLTVTVSDGGVAVTESDCPDGICRQTGIIRRPGEAIICAPGRIVIRITGGERDEDFILG